MSARLFEGASSPRAGGSTPADLRARFATDGFAVPLPVLTPTEAQALRRQLEAYERTGGAEAAGVLRHKGHIVLPWLADLIRHERILSAVSAILGPDLLCWTTNAFIKEPDDGKFVSWHQDAAYWGLSSNDVVTAWVAFTASRPDNGCMRVIPGSHRWPVQPHRDTHHPANLLTRGQELEVAVDESQAVHLLLEPGQMSLHHVLIAHASGYNRSGDRRIGMAIRYIPTSVHQSVALADSATLVAGTDQFGHFQLEPRPRGPEDPVALAFHRAVMANTDRLLHRPLGRSKSR
jgi:non-haem Fe2+, alpha-ketoglutarate-dependent halogenase